MTKGIGRSWFRTGALALVCVTLASGCRRSEKSIQPPKPPPPAELWKEFSGTAAYEHVRALVEMGPRPGGSPEIEQARIYIIEQLQQTGWNVVRQTFMDKTPRGEMEFANLIARFAGNPEAARSATPPPLGQRYIIASHYDTKWYDSIRFVGANDGGSSTGALLEMARVLARDPDRAATVELVFFDGEEAFAQFTESDGLYGSRFYARNLRDTGRAREIKAGILWDMIGDRDLTVTLPPDSPAELARGIFASAEALGVRSKFGLASRPIWDDHVPLNHAGIPTLDIIDFDYRYWHTADDTLDKLDPGSLEIVGQVTLYWLVKYAPEFGKN
jgi:glutaminyl-peptide cyclotransferase